MPSSNQRWKHDAVYVLAKRYCSEIERTTSLYAPPLGRVTTVVFSFHSRDGAISFGQIALTCGAVLSASEAKLRDDKRWQVSVELKGG